MKMKQTLFEWCVDNQRMELIEQWDYNKNGQINPKNVTPCSGKKVWWKCEVGHEWEAYISNRNRGQGCPFCSGHRVLKGYNDFESQYPELAKDWDYERNIDLLPSEVAPKSDKEVWWKCSEGHSWKAPVKRRVLGSGCPVCANKKIVEGYNDLKSQYPAIVTEWDYSKNGEFLPTQVTYGSDKKVWWKCERGHSWQAIIGDRVRGQGCPYCSKRKTIKSVLIGGKSIPEREVSGSRILRGYNDLVTLYPELLKEWDYEKNVDVAPETIGRGSELKVWWECEKGHSWQAIVSNRVKGIGCPICSKGQRISFGEKAVFCFMKLAFPNAQENYKTQWLGRSEVDIYIPEINVAIEYDGFLWHKNIQKDLKKDKLCNENNILLIRIREPETPLYESTSIKYCMKKNTDIEIESAIKFIYDLIRNKYGIIDFPKVNVDKVKEQIYAMVYQSQVNNSLMEQYPELLEEWDYEKNGELKPEMVFAKSKIKVWWRCKLGHSWQSAVYARTNGGGCPICNGKKVLSGYNDLVTLRPDITKEWNLSKNKFSPDTVASKSNKKVWWICEKGHEWEAKINNRTSNNQGCPVCRGQKVLKGYNDLMTLYPEIANEWDYEKNGDIRPDMVRPHSNKAVWWVCPECKKSYKKVITYRTTNNTGCPDCYKEKRRKKSEGER